VYTLEAMPRSYRDLTVRFDDDERAALDAFAHDCGGISIAAALRMLVHRHLMTPATKPKPARKKK
jgi:hypothetical protein